MTEPIDEYSISHLREFEDHPFACIQKEDFELPESDDEKAAREQANKEFEPLCNKIKEVLDKHVEKVIVSTRLVSSPCCIVANKHSMTGNMERISRAQTMRSQPSKPLFSNKKIFEINTKNSIVVNLNKQFAQDARSKSVRDLITILWETASLQCGFSLDEPKTHASRIHQMIMMGLGLEDDVLDEEADPGNQGDCGTSVDADAEKVVDQVADKAQKDQLVNELLEMD